MITLPRAQLAAELALLNAIAGGRATVIPALSMVKLEFDGETLTLTASDCDVTVIAEVAGAGDPWAGCVPCGQLAVLVKLLNTETVEFAPKDGLLQVKAGRSRHKLPLVSVTEFPEIHRASGESFSLPLAQLTAMIKATSFAMLEPFDGVREVERKYTGLSFRVINGRLECMATQKVVTAIAEVDSQLASFATILNRNAVAVLAKLDGESVAVQIDASHAEFVAGHRTVICRPLVGEFPDWRMFVPEMPIKATVAGSDLSAAIRRASVTMGIDNAVGFEPMRATWTSDMLSVETRGGERGYSVEQVAVTSNLNGEPLAIGFVGQQVLSVLAKCEGDVTVELAAPDKPMVFRDARATFIVMPIGLRW